MAKSKTDAALDKQYEAAVSSFAEAQRQYVKLLNAGSFGIEASDWIIQTAHFAHQQCILTLGIYSELIAARQSRNES